MTHRLPGWLRVSALLGALAAPAGSSLPAQRPPAPLARPAGLPTGLEVRVLSQSPAAVPADLEIICLFRAAAPTNRFAGPLAEIDRRLHGQLDRLHRPGVWPGDLGQTLGLTPQGSLPARRLYILGLGDPGALTLERMERIGRLAFTVANGSGAAHPYFAPTSLEGDGGRYGPQEIAAQVVMGFREAWRDATAAWRDGRGRPVAVRDLIYLAGPDQARDTRRGIDRAMGVERGGITGGVGESK